MAFKGRDSVRIQITINNNIIEEINKTNCKELKKNTNIRQITGIKEKLDTTCK